VSDLLDALEGFEFLFGVANEVGILGAEVAVDDLDGLEDAAGGFALPDFAEPARPEPFEEPIAWNGFGL
jgi:hypothetical protein